MNLDLVRKVVGMRSVRVTVVRVRTHVVDRLGSGPRVVGRLVSRVSVSANFQIFALSAGGMS